MERENVTCEICGKQFDVAHKTFLYHNRIGTGFKCSSCQSKLKWSNMSEESKKQRSSQISAKKKALWENKSKEEKDQQMDLLHKGHMKWWSEMSDDDKLNFSKKSSNNVKKYLDSLTDEEKIERSKKLSNGAINRWANMTNEEKEKIKLNMSNITKKHWDNMSKEDREKCIQILHNYRDKYQNKHKKEISKKVSEIWNNRPTAEKENLLNKLDEGNKRWRENLTDEDRENISEIQKQNSLIRWNNISDEERKKFSEHISEITKAFWNNISNEERERISKIESQKRLEYWDSLNDEQRNEIIKSLNNGMRNWWDNLSDSSKINHGNKIREKWINLPISFKEDFIRKRIMASGGNNKFHQHFEQAFSESHLINGFYYIAEYPTMNNDVMHCWDYGMFNENGELVAVVDLDGAYFHADVCDYDGIHSREEYDERRALSVSNDVPICIINELRFKQCFERLIHTVMLDYDDYIEKMFRECRSMPFPYPHYTDIELMKSWNKLQRMDCNDKYHQDISLNTRVGDRLIQHFHQSIWHDHCDGELSPYEAWQNDDLLHEVIRNRIIYQTHLNPNKILQGFNIAKKAPKVSVFSAGRAKMIISKYLNEFDTIFDPFSGYSGRMLGAIACGKSYIGQDLSERHVLESNEIMKFLHTYAISFDTIITQCDILKSSGKYECLFTCPPYSTKEQWEDVPVDPRTCDDWINECLKRFHCKRYVFVVDSTKRYKDHIVDKISNKSHFSNAKEYIIIIDRD